MEAARYELVTPRLRLRALALDEMRMLIQRDRAALGERIGASIPADWPGSNLGANLPGIASAMSVLSGDERWVWVVIEPAA